MAGDLDRDQVIADAPTPPERIIDTTYGYSTDEIAALKEFMAEKETLCCIRISSFFDRTTAEWRASSHLFTGTLSMDEITMKS